MKGNLERSLAPPPVGSLEKRRIAVSQFANVGIGAEIAFVAVGASKLGIEARWDGEEYLLREQR